MKKKAKWQPAIQICLIAPLDIALFDALQKNRTENNFSLKMISVAPVRASQLEQCLVTGIEPSEGTIQATLDLISLGQEPSGLTHLADKVSTVSHTFKCACTDKQQ